MVRFTPRRLILPPCPVVDRLKVLPVMVPPMLMLPPPPTTEPLADTRFEVVVRLLPPMVRVPSRSKGPVTERSPPEMVTPPPFAMTTALPAPVTLSEMAPVDFRVTPLTSMSVLDVTDMVPPEFRAPSVTPLPPVLTSVMLPEPRWVSARKVPLMTAPVRSMLPAVLVTVTLPAVRPLPVMFAPGVFTFREPALPRFRVAMNTSLSLISVRFKALNCQRYLAGSECAGIGDKGRTASIVVEDQGRDRGQQWATCAYTYG